MLVCLCVCAVARARTYVRLCVVWTGMHLYILTHIFPLTVVVGRGGEQRKRRVGEGGEKKLQSRFLFLSNFMAGKCLF